MIDLTMSVDEINQILGVLGRQPFQEVEALIANIRRQALPQLPPKVAE